MWGFLPRVSRVASGEPQPEGRASPARGAGAFPLELPARWGPCAGARRRMRSGGGARESVDEVPFES